MNRASLLPPPNRSAAALACHAAQREYCLPSAATFYRCDSVRRLWLLRHHYTARLLNMRYNVLLLDSDSMVLADPYPLVRRHLQGYTALCLHDITARPFMAVNGGTWYVRGASPEGPVQRLFASAFERASRRYHYELPAAAAPFAASHIPGRHVPCTLLFTVNLRPFFTGPPPFFPFSLNM